MRVGFAGTPEFAAVALRELLREGFDIPWVLTQPDRPAGRGMRLQASPVKRSVSPDCHVLQPRGLRLDGKWGTDAAQTQDYLDAHPVDVIVVVAYGLILPRWVLNHPRLGCLNIHASLLPRWRGAAPIHRAIEAGDAETGVCIMAMEEGLDTGPVYLESRIDIGARETTPALHDRLAALGAANVVTVLRQLGHSTLLPRPQTQAGTTYAHKVQRLESQLRWKDAAVTLDRKIRAFQPFPGIQFGWQGESIKVLEAYPVDGTRQGTREETRLVEAGTILRVDSEGVVVATGDGALSLVRLQRPSGKPLPSGLMAHALGWQAGTLLADGNGVDGNGVM